MNTDESDVFTTNARVCRYFQNITLYFSDQKYILNTKGIPTHGANNNTFCKISRERSHE